MLKINYIKNSVSFVIKLICKMSPIILVYYSIIPSIHAAEKYRDVDGANGILNISGSLMESPCSLSMDSIRQDIDMGSVETSRLLTIGNEASKKQIRIKLDNCVRASSRNADLHTGNTFINDTQPSVSVIFKAETLPGYSDYILVNGHAGGIAMKLSDDKGQYIKVGEKTSIKPLSVGNNELVYYLSLVRTPENLKAGNYRSLIFYSLDYL